MSTTMPQVPKVTAEQIVQFLAAARETITAGDRFVALGGRATIIDDVAEMRTMWSSERDAQFPPGFADANMIVIRVDVDRIEVHARGLPPEPFGAGRTLLERQPDGTWRFIPPW